MRLFLGITLSGEVRDALTQLQERLKASGADVRWVEPGNFHVTIKFIGDQPDAYLPEIEAVGEEVAMATFAFSLGVRGTGAFPKRGPLKTLWAGVKEGASEWKNLALRAEKPLAAYGVPREGGLVPHITLGRVRSEQGMDALRAALAAEADTDCGTQPADRITLIQSTLDPRGAIYTPLREWDLPQKT